MTNEENLTLNYIRKKKDALEKGGLEFVQDINVEKLYECG